MKKNSLINSSWLIIEKVISMLGLFLVSAFVARYIGPSMVGQIALAIACFQIVIVVAQFGSENIIIKRLSKKRLSGIKLAKTSLILRVIIYILCAAGILLYVRSDNYVEFVFFCAVGIASFFTAIDVVATYNDTNLNSKRNAILNLFGLIISLAMRYIIVYMQLNPLLLTLPIITTTLIPFMMRVYFYYMKDEERTKNIRQEKYLQHFKYLIMTGSAMFIANISVAIYPRVNIFFLSELSGSHELGIYSVAVTLATSWNFIMLAFVTSCFPSIYNEENENLAAIKTTQLNVIIAVISTVVIVGFIIFGSYIIKTLYGPAFTTAWRPAVILCAGTMLSAMGAVSSRYIVKFSGYRYLSYKSFIALLLCIPVSYFLIKNHGITGAACSVVALEFLSLTVLNYGYKNGTVFKMHRLTLTFIPALLSHLWQQRQGKA
ncbi:oligosaccharide flippase family protein [Mangrovibacter phragmitis]|uniref:oligosaccharide flippase family protein n=1 Tax=Mangrovibacter phragmitis TaxID=1691903 RepID=UPI00336AEA86